MTIAAIRSSSSISTTPSTSLRNSPDPAFAAGDVRKDEAFPTGCDDDRREIRDPDVGSRMQVCDLGILTAPDSCVYDPPAIVGKHVVGQ